MQLSKKQKEYIRCANKRYGFKIGAVRSGKSFVDTAFVIPWRIRQRMGKPGLVVFFGVSAGTIERNILEPMREIYTDKLVGNIRTGKGTAMVFGEEVWCIGTEKISSLSKIQGISIKYAYGDEIAKWNPDVFAMIESRLDKDYSCMDGACNPESPNHWFKKWLDTPGLDAYIQQYVLFDNPFLPKSFIDNLCTEYAGTVYYDRYILGKWALAEGLIYPMYAQAIAEPPEGVAERYVLSLDYGTQNAFAALMWGKYGDTWCAVDGYYYSGRTTGIQKTDEDYGHDMDTFVSAYISLVERITVIIDPSAASFIALLRKRDWAKVRPADNDVADGIRETATVMQKGVIKISPDIKEWRDEVEGYIWDPDAEEKGEDKPVKVNDHYMDSMRYFVKTMKLVKPKDHYRPLTFL